MDYKALYDENKDFKLYVDKYCKTYKCTVNEALGKMLVQMVGREYKKQAETIIRKE